MPVGEHADDLVQVVDEQAVDDPVPAALGVVADLGPDPDREAGQRVAAPADDQLGALHVAQ